VAPAHVHEVVRRHSRPRLTPVRGALNAHRRNRAEVVYDLGHLDQSKQRGCSDKLGFSHAFDPKL